MKFTQKILVKDSRRFLPERPAFPNNLIVAAEDWVMKNIWLTDPQTEREIRICTYNTDDDWDFEFTVPEMYSDRYNETYGEFVEVAKYIGQAILTHWNNTGCYYYIVQVRLAYDNIKYDGKYTSYELWYDWGIKETDNPRCVCSNNTVRKDCRWTRTPFCYSRMSIAGYDINGQYKLFTDLINELANKAIVVHSKSDVKALMNIFRFLGVKRIKKADRLYLNNPRKRAFFSQFTPAYRLEKHEGEWVLTAIQHFDITDDINDVLDIDELIVRRSLKARLRDLRPITN